MTDAQPRRPTASNATRHPGLCAACRWSARVDSARGSTFLRCGRSDDDPRYPRYPALPVLRCDGFEARPTE